MIIEVLSIWGIVIISFVALYVIGLTLKMEIEFNKKLKKDYPPRIDYHGKKGICYVSVYEKNQKGCTLYDYHKYTFIRKKNGKWKYEIEKKVLFLLLCYIPILMWIICFIGTLGIAGLKYVIGCSLGWKLFVYWLANKEARVARKALKDFLLKKEKECTNGSEKKVKKNSRKKRDIIDDVDKKVYKYEKTSKIVKCIEKTIVFMIWLGVLAVFSIILIYTCILLENAVGINGFFLPAVTIVFLSGFTLITRSWVGILGLLMGDYSCSVSVNEAIKHKKYAPEKILAKLINNRRNVIYVENEQGRVQIYGAGETLVLEIRIGYGDDHRVFHMIDFDPEMDETTIMPVTDDSIAIIENRWHEKFPVRKSRLVNEDGICDFLRKLYECKDLKAAMEKFSFEDTTEEIHKLIEADAYIVPEVPVDWPVGGIKSNMGAEWMRKKEDRVQRAQDILSHMK